MDMSIFINDNGVYDEKKAFAARLEYLNSNHADEMAELKANYSFHSLKFSDDMDRWFDLWRKHKNK